MSKSKLPSHTPSMGKEVILSTPICGSSRASGFWFSPPCNRQRQYGRPRVSKGARLSPTIQHDPTNSIAWTASGSDETENMPHLQSDAVPPTGLHGPDLVVPGQHGRPA